MEPKAGQPLSRHVPADNNGGWLVAGATVILAIVLVAGALYINRTRYHSPNDVLAPSGGNAAAQH